MNKEFTNVIKYNKQVKELSINIEKFNCFVFNMIYTEFEYLFMKSISSYNFKTSKNIINDWETLINKFMKGLDSVDPDKEILNILN